MTSSKTQLVVSALSCGSRGGIKLYVDMGVFFSVDGWTTMLWCPSLFILSFIMLRVKN